MAEDDSQPRLILDGTSIDATNAYYQPEPIRPRRAVILARLGRVLLPPRSEPGPLDEPLWDRTKRDAARVRGAWSIRAAFVLVNAALAIAVAEVLVGANKPGTGIAAWTLLALVGAGVIEFVSVYATQALAGLRRQGNEARSAFPLAETKQRDELGPLARAHASAMAAIEESNERREATKDKQIEQLGAEWTKVAEDRERIRGLLGNVEQERDTAIKERDKAQEQLLALHDPTRTEGLRVAIDAMVKRGFTLYEELNAGPEPTKTDEEGRGISFPFFPPDSQWDAVMVFDREARELLRGVDAVLLFTYADAVNAAKRKMRRRERQRDENQKKLPSGEQMQFMIERLHRRPAEEVECYVAALVDVKKEL